MHDLAILTCRYFGALFVIWAIACAGIGSIQPISVLAGKGYYSARARRGARRTLVVVFIVSSLVAALGAILVWGSFHAR